jgi:hypothetical protein
VKCQKDFNVRDDPSRNGKMRTERKFKETDFVFVNFAVFWDVFTIAHENIRMI